MAPKFRRTDDGLLEQDVNGYKALVIDPDGSYEREHSAPAPDAYAAIAPPVAPPVASGIDTMTPEQKAALAAPSVVGPTANPGAPMPAAGPAAPAVAPMARASIVPEPEVVTMPGAGPNTKTVSTTGYSSEGLDAASKKKLEAAGAKSRSSEQAAIDAEKQAGTDVAASREARAKQDYMSGFIKQVGAQEAEQRYKTDYEAAMQERKAARQQPLDPSKAFGSEKNQWAFIAGLGGALAALDEGIARLQKRGGAQPFDMIDKMVEASIKQQEGERTQRLLAAGEDVEAAREAMLEQRSNAHEAAAQVLDARKLLASSSEEAQFLDAAAAKQRMQADLRDEERAKALATRKSTQGQTVTTVEQGGGGGSMLVVPGSERAAQDQKLVQDTLMQAYPGLKPKDAQDQWDEFQKRYTDTAAMRTAVQNAQAAIAESAKSGDVPGFGPIAKLIPTDFASLDAVQKRQAVGQAVSMYIKSISGAAATDKESERLLTNIQGSGDYATMSSGLSNLAEQSHAVDNEMQKTKPQLHKLAEYLGQRQGSARGASKASETY